VVKIKNSTVPKIVDKTFGKTEVAVSQKKAFGYELLLDLYEVKEGVCDNLDLCYDFLDKLAIYIKVNKQSPPSIFRTDGELYPDKAGLSGWVPLVESSIVIHTLSPKRFITVDVYSCRRFDIDKVKEFVNRYFEPEKVEAQFLERGLKYFEIEAQ